jgi:benzoate-CoA ligase family protein
VRYEPPSSTARGARGARGLYNATEPLLLHGLHGLEQGGARVAVRDESGTYTYAALADRVNRAGNALLAAGVRREERVLLATLDTVDFMAAFLGAMRIGAVPVPVNTLLQPHDYVHLVADSRPRAVVVSDALLPKLALALETALEAGARVFVAHTPAGPHGQGTTARANFTAWDEACAAASPELAPAPTTADDVAFWLYSSGSTGRPKGAMHLHSHLAQTSALYAQGVLGLREDDVVYSAAKLFFAYGLGNALTFPLTIGATAVLTSQRPTPAVVREVFKEHRPTVFCGVPTLFASILADPTFEPSVARCLRVSISAGEALPRHVGERWKERFGTDILDGIGSTEMLHIFLSNSPGDVRYGTSGKPVPGYELKIVDDHGAPVADGEEGSLWVSGPTSAIGYWNDRARSLATFHGPWTRTGDRYVRDRDGYFTYVGRSDDMLKVGGIWVSPFEVESALARHEAVLECAVVGHTDADGLTKPKAFVVLKDRARVSPGIEEDLKAFVKSELAPYKYPRWIALVDELPKTATGKIQRFKLRDGA